MAEQVEMSGQTRGAWQEFKDFITRGNVVDLAIAIVIGIAFGAVVSALINGILMPLIAAIFGEANFDALIANVGDGRILYGTFITALINFLVVAAVMFGVVKALAAMQKPKTVTLDEPPTETEILTEIRDLLAAGRVR